MHHFLAGHLGKLGYYLFYYIFAKKELRQFFMLLYLPFLLGIPKKLTCIFFTVENAYTSTYVHAKNYLVDNVNFYIIYRDVIQQFKCNGWEYTMKWVCYIMAIQEGVLA